MQSNGVACGQHLHLLGDLELSLISDLTDPRRDLLNGLRQDFVLFLYCVSGRAEIKALDGADLAMSAEDILVLFPGRTISVRLASSRGRLMALGLRGGDAVSSAMSIGYWDLFRASEPYRGDFFSALCEAQRKSCAGGRDPKVLEMIEHFLDTVWRSVRTRSEKGVFMDVVRRIGELQMDALTTESVARTLGFSRTKLNDLFMGALGRRPGDFLKNIRMEHARSLLYWSNLSIKEIGVHVGYANAPAFTHAFRQMFGVTPKEYRRSPFENNRTIS